MKTLLHVGCGPIKLPGFVNIDIEPSHNPDLVLDCLKLNAHFPVNTVDAIFSCHMIEHLPYPLGVMVFLDLARFALKPGGILRLVVPNLALAAKAYENGSDLKFIYGPDFKGYYHKDCPAERFRFFMTAWQHQIVFDYQLLEMLLCDAGFPKVRSCAFGQSETPELRGHDRFQSESLVVEATK